MKLLLIFASLILFTACGSGGPPPPDWKTDSADLITRYQKHALLGEKTVAERYFQQAIAATGGAGRVADTARLWLVRCTTRRAMLVDDPCTEYAELAKIEQRASDHAYYQFVTLHWDGMNTALLPAQHQDLLRTARDKRPEVLRRMTDPLARLLDASLLVLKQEADARILEVAVETASEQGWRQPLLTYLKLQEKQAVQLGNVAEQERLSLRIKLVEDSLFRDAK